jgi:hypothetical protein
VATPWSRLTTTRITAAHAPTARSVGATARATDPADIIVTAATSARGAERANHERQGEEPVNINQRMGRVGIEELGTEVRSESGVEVEVEPLHEIGHRTRQDDTNLSASIRMRPSCG